MHGIGDRTLLCLKLLYHRLNSIDPRLDGLGALLYSASVLLCSITPNDFIILHYFTWKNNVVGNWSRGMILA